MKSTSIKVIKNKYPDRDYTVNIEFPEFTCVCPRSGLPDFAAISIEYVPDKLIVELKSLKMYFFSYRNTGIFHENAVNRILDDFVAACRPRRAKITGSFNVRGGIKTVVEAEYPQ
jgi:7-cyano-7-deazaguanine reductase